MHRDVRLHDPPGQRPVHSILLSDGSLQLVQASTQVDQLITINNHNNNKQQQGFLECSSAFDIWPHSRTIKAEMKRTIDAVWCVYSLLVQSNDPGPGFERLFTCSSPISWV